jgi:DNA-binding response OmpR family regulator
VVATISFALRAVDAFPPDVVLIGPTCPGVEADTVAAQVRRQPAGKRAFVVAVTEHPAERSPHCAEEATDLRLPPPVGPSYLRGLLRRLQRILG